MKLKLSAHLEVPGIHKLVWRLTPAVRCEGQIKGAKLDTCLMSTVFDCRTDISSIIIHITFLSNTATAFLKIFIDLVKKKKNCRIFFSIGCGHAA